MEFTNETIDTTTLPRFEEIVLTRLERGYWKVQLLTIATTFIILGGLVGLSYFVVDEAPQAIWEILAAYFSCLLLTLFFCRLSFIKKGFAFREHDVILRHGVIATKTIVIPYNRIQHVALHEGVYSRIFDLAEVKVYTAGGNSGDIDIPGIRKEQAEDIKQLLMGQNPKNALMQNDYSKPQRQSAIGVLVMFGDALQGIGRAFLPFILVWAVKFREGDQLVFILGLLIFLIIIAVVAYLRYLNFTFYLDDENQEFVLTEGILSKTKTVVKVSKIQKVDIKQSLLQRIIGVHTLEIDTAGTNKEEVAIKAISHDLALDLKEKLLGARSMTPVNEAGIATEMILEEEKPFVKISLWSLVKMGFTAHYVRSFLLMFAFIMSIYDSLQKVMGYITLDTGRFDSYVEQTSYPELAAVFLFFLIVIILLVNVFRTVFRFFDYTIMKQRDSLLLSFGLLNTKNTLIRPERVQFVSVTQNFFQRKLDILELKIRQATGGEQEQRKTAIEVPGCNAGERDEILKLLFREIPQRGLMLKPNWRKLGFSLFLLVVLPLGLYFLVRNSNPEVEQADYFIPFYIAIVIILQYFKFRNNRLFAGDRFIIKQSGAWDVKNEMVSINKIQGITTSQLFWHKNLNIGSLTLHTAGGDIAFQLGNFEIIRRYANQWLYEIEISGSNWM